MHGTVWFNLTQWASIGALVGIVFAHAVRTGRIPRFWEVQG